LRDSLWMVCGWLMDDWRITGGWLRDSLWMVCGWLMDDWRIIG
jgi:hypothetical protein